MKISDDILSEIYKEGSSKENMSGDIQEILNFPLDLREKCLGKTHEGFYNFSEWADLEHPDMSEAFSPLFCQRVLELLKIADFAKDFDIFDNLPYLIKKDLKEINFKDLKRRVRLAKYEEVRKKMRAAKKCLSVFLKYTFSKGEIVWQGTPDNFDCYVRNSEKYKNDIVKEKQMSQRYQEMGCDFLYEMVMKSIKEYEEMFNDIHYGFRRLTVANASLILAKKLGGVWEKGCVSLNGNLFTPMIQPIVNTSLTLHSFAMNPRLTTEVLDLIAYLEKFPEANNKPIFDHYLCISQVLLGERDGKCYFICNWD
jgi:hypothetical protein